VPWWVKPTGSTSSSAATSILPWVPNQ
jgi:hypothetical protein